MRTIQINYDLGGPGRNYAAVEAYIKSFGSWDHLLESCWLVSTAKTPATVRDELNAIVDRNDRVAVFEVTACSWATNFKDDRTAWLQRAA